MENKKINKQQKELQSKAWIGKKQLNEKKQKGNKVIKSFSVLLMS